jgi:GntR family transcriptional regulator
MKFDDGIPIYLQIKEEIENAIVSGSIKEEDSIPSIRVLAQQYKLNPQTISSAVSELMNSDVLYKKRGIGMFVNKGAREMLRKKKMKEFTEIELCRIIEKGINLGITKDDFIVMINSVYQEKGAKL